MEWPAHNIASVLCSLVFLILNLYQHCFPNRISICYCCFDIILETCEGRWWNNLVLQDWKLFFIFFVADWVFIWSLSRFLFHHTFFYLWLDFCIILKMFCSSTSQHTPFLFLLACCDNWLRRLAEFKSQLVNCIWRTVEMLLSYAILSWSFIRLKFWLRTRDPKAPLYKDPSSDQSRNRFWWNGFALRCPYYWNHGTELVLSSV